MIMRCVVVHLNVHIHIKTHVWNILPIALMRFAVYVYVYATHFRTQLIRYNVMM